MANFINIKDFDGVLTNADIEDLPDNVAQEIKNLKIQAGKLEKTFGTGAPSGIPEFGLSFVNTTLSTSYVVYNIYTFVSDKFAGDINEAGDGYRYLLVTIDADNDVKLWWYDSGLPNVNDHLQIENDIVWFKTASAHGIGIDEYVLVQDCKDNASPQADITGAGVYDYADVVPSTTEVAINTDDAKPWGGKFFTDDTADGITATSFAGKHSTHLTAFDSATYGGSDISSLNTIGIASMNGQVLALCGVTSTDVIVYNGSTKVDLTASNYTTYRSKSSFAVCSMLGFNNAVYVHYTYTDSGTDYNPLVKYTLSSSGSTITETVVDANLSTTDNGSSWMHIYNDVLYVLIQGNGLWKVSTSDSVSSLTVTGATTSEFAGLSSIAQTNKLSSNGSTSLVDVDHHYLFVATTDGTNYKLYSNDILDPSYTTWDLNLTAAGNLKILKSMDFQQNSERSESLVIHRTTGSLVGGDLLYELEYTEHNDTTVVFRTFELSASNFPTATSNITFIERTYNSPGTVKLIIGKKNYVDGATPVNGTLYAVNNKIVVSSLRSPNTGIKSNWWPTCFADTVTGAGFFTHAKGYIASYGQDGSVQVTSSTYRDIAGLARITDIGWLNNTWAGSGDCDYRWVDILSRYHLEDHTNTNVKDDTIGGYTIQTSPSNAIVDTYGETYIIGTSETSNGALSISGGQLNITLSSSDNYLYVYMTTNPAVQILNSLTFVLTGSVTIPAPVQNVNFNYLQYYVERYTSTGTWEPVTSSITTLSSGVNLKITDTSGSETYRVKIYSSEAGTTNLAIKLDPGTLKDTSSVATLNPLVYHKKTRNPIIVSGDTIRFLTGNVGEISGNESKELWLGYIDRSLFNNTISASANWYVYTNRLMNPFTFSDFQLYGTGDSLRPGSSVKYNLTTVYDGVQETLFDKSKELILTETNVNNSIVELSIVFDALLLNKRITGINVYRAVEFANTATFDGYDNYQLVGHMTFVDSQTPIPTTTQDSIVRLHVWRKDIVFIKSPMKNLVPYHGEGLAGANKYALGTQGGWDGIDTSTKWTGPTGAKRFVVYHSPLLRKVNPLQTYIVVDAITTDNIMLDEMDIQIGNEFLKIENQSGSSVSDDPFDSADISRADNDTGITITHSKRYADQSAINSDMGSDANIISTFPIWRLETDSNFNPHPYLNDGDVLHAPTAQTNNSLTIEDIQSVYGSPYDYYIWVSGGPTTFTGGSSDTGVNYNVYLATANTGTIVTTSRAQSNLAGTAGTFTQSCTTTGSSTSVAVASGGNNSLITEGMSVTGTNIVAFPASTIESITRDDSNVVTHIILNQVASGSATSTLTFSTAIEHDANSNIGLVADNIPAIHYKMNLDSNASNSDSYLDNSVMVGSDWKIEERSWGSYSEVSASENYGKSGGAYGGPSIGFIYFENPDDITGTLGTDATGNLLTTDSYAGALLQCPGDVSYQIENNSAYEPALGGCWVKLNENHEEFGEEDGTEVESNSGISKDNIRVINGFSRTNAEGSTTPGMGFELVTNTDTEKLIRLVCQDYRLEDLGETDSQTIYSDVINASHAVNLKGRLFLSNLVLNPDGKKEDRADWISYSDLNQLDSRPVSNVISLNDKEGGGITGLAVLFGRLVVFKPQAIFILNVPDPADPNSWTVVESKHNIGNISPQGLVEVHDSIYFVYYDGIYRIDSNMVADSFATPTVFEKITLVIEDQFLDAISKKSIKGIYNHNDSEVLYTWDAGSPATQVVWAYHIIHKTWRKVDTTTNLDILAYDENSAPLAWDDTDTDIKKFDVPEAVGTAWKSKRFPLDLDRKRLIRYGMVKFTGTDTLTVNIYLDGAGSASFTKTITADGGINRFPIKRYGKNFEIELTTPSSLNAFSIEQMRIETE